MISNLRCCRAGSEILFIKTVILQFQLCLSAVNSAKNGIQEEEEQDGKEDTTTVRLDAKSFITFPEINVLSVVFEGVEGQESIQ